MKKLLLNFWNNLDNDQRGIVKSTSIISLVVLPTAFAGFNTLIPLILAGILQAIVTPLFANKVTHKNKYIFDKKSNKKFKTDVTEKFLKANVILYFSVGFAMLMIERHPYLKTCMALIPMLATRVAAFKLKLPVSALLLRSLPKKLRDKWNRSSYMPHKFDPAYSFLPDNIHNQRSNPAYSFLPDNIYHNRK